MNKDQIYVDSKDRKVYNIDFDGTLTDGSSYEKLEPNMLMIEKTRRLYFQGNIIIIWSARQWNDSNKIASWCLRYGVPFHGLMLAKGGSDYYIDDKAINVNDFLEEELI